VVLVRLWEVARRCIRCRFLEVYLAKVGRSKEGIVYAFWVNMELRCDPAYPLGLLVLFAIGRFHRML
jgi:nitrate reductase beta subunit